MNSEVFIGSNIGCADVDAVAKNSSFLLTPPGGRDL